MVTSWVYYFLLNAQAAIHIGVRLCCSKDQKEFKLLRCAVVTPCRDVTMLLKQDWQDAEGGAAGGEGSPTEEGMEIDS